MASIDVEDLSQKMVQAASGVLSAHWGAAKSYAEVELGKIATAIEFIGGEVLAGRMTPARAQLHIEMQKNAATTVLLTVHGLNLLAVEGAINAALGVVKDTVNTALGFALL